MGLIQRKEVALSKDVIDKLQKKADLEKRSLKNYMEVYLESLANDRVILVKK